MQRSQRSRTGSSAAPREGAEAGMRCLIDLHPEAVALRWETVVGPFGMQSVPAFRNTVAARVGLPTATVSPA